MTAAVNGATAGEVGATERVAAVAGRIRTATAPFAVVDGEGRRVGAVTRDAVADVLLQG
jgi:hypothetical protein